jgi:iron complex outermembrane recepter protein
MINRPAAAAVAWIMLIAAPVDGQQPVAPQDPPRAIRSDSTPPAPGSVSKDTSRTSRLDEVVVTALRIPMEIGDAAYAVARNGPDVTNRARPGLGLTETLHGIAGVQVDNRYNFALGERITVRGFGARTQFGVRGVRVLVDGIPATMPDGQTTLNHLDLGTVELVEVVRTPIAALYGNAAGGVIAIQTAQAPAAPIAVTSRVVSGSDGLARRQLGIGGSTEAGSYLLRAGRLDYDGFRAHNKTQNRYFSARTTADIGPAALALTFHRVAYDALNPGSLPDSLVRRDRTAAFPFNVAQNTGESGRHSQAGLTMERPLGELVLATSLYGVRRELENPIPPRIIDLSRRAGGVRMSIGSKPAADARLQWDTGIEWAAQHDDRLNHANQGGARGELTLDQEERVRATAAFAAARARLTERALLQLGLRADATTFEVTDRLITATNPDDSGERLMRSWNPSAGISVRVGREARIFANVGTAFETPTTTELANRPDGAGGFNPGLNPQRTRSAEVGLNGFTPRAWYQLALYASRVSGALVPFEVPAAPGRQFFRNAAAARHRGAELMAGGRITRGVDARAAYTFTDARYRDYTADAASYDGNRLPGVAPHRVETLLRISSMRTFLDLESRYQSRLPTNDENSVHSAAFAVHGVRAGLTGLRWARFGGAPFVGIDNVLNRTHNSSVVVNAAAGRYFEPGPGRTIYIGLDLTAEAARPRSATEAGTQ